MSNLKRFVIAALFILFALTGCSKTTISPKTFIPAQEESAQESVSYDIENLPEDAKNTGVHIIDEPVEIDRPVDAGNIVYDGIDSLGRTRRVVGNITYNMVEESAGWRCKFDSDVDKKLSGWGDNSEVDVIYANGKHYHGYFWNRSHLIADSLGGYNHVYNSDGSIDKKNSKTQVQNLITGTRFQNVGQNDGNGGMAYFETRVTKFLKDNPNVTVWYSAEPIYKDNEIIPRGVLVKVKSSDGNLVMQGFVYNVMPGYTIDYNTGSFTKE